MLKVGMDSMRLRVSELEKECSNMRQEIEKLGRGKSGWSSVSKFGFKIKSQMCSAQESSVNDQKSATGKLGKQQQQLKLTKHRKQLSIEE